VDVSYIALAAVIVALARLALDRFGAAPGPAQDLPAPSRLRSVIYSFLAGVLLANSIPHFIHGISGEYFPGPFFHSLGRGTGTDVVNVLWGLFCFGTGYRLAWSYRKQLSPALFRVTISSGFAAMSIFLSVVFSKGTFRS
jgi:hypothetical protein